ncbi:hypothetical protein ZOSMA_162G00180 [Zostera marina]|uniref:Uncharacterized protein n=1 Tax=Zostera marina TaxID=29655 RepID=A0A0K9PTX2_ZOSMR|nr:hypothetical protein ZOSMA_162G00180 [Zostera marina]
MEVSEFPLSYKSYGPPPENITSKFSKEYPRTLIQPTLHQFLHIRKRKKINLNHKCDMWKLRNRGSTSKGDYVQPIEIHSSSSMSSSLALINFQLPDILSTELRNSSSFDLNLEYVSPIKSSVLPSSIVPEDIDLCHQSSPDADNNIIDHCQSVSVSKSNSTIKSSSPIPMSDPMPIDLPLNIFMNNLNHSVCNEDLINSVSCIDLNMNYVSPIKAICRPNFDLLNISDLSNQRNASAAIDNIYHSKSFSLTKSINCIKSSDIIQQSFITLAEPKMCLDGVTVALQLDSVTTRLKEDLGLVSQELEERANERPNRIRPGKKNSSFVYY